MARKVQVLLVDDIDGTSADETVIFGLDGAEYEIDLSQKNASRLRDALAKYVDAGRRTKRRGGSRRRSTSTSDPAAVREWARENGIAVNERGRVPADLVAQFEAAQR